MRAALHRNARRIASQRPISSSKSRIFPLRKSANGRYLVQSDGTPFLLWADSAWPIVTALTCDQITSYLDDRSTRGFSCVMAQAISTFALYNTPDIANAYGHEPFTTANDFATPNPAYFQILEFVISEAEKRGMAVLLWPGYLGYLGGSQGWDTAINAEIAADLRSYGQYLMRRLQRYDNVIYVAGGDYSNAASIDQQWHMFLGLQDVVSDVLVSCHGARGDEAYAVLSNHLTGTNLLNGIYTGTADEYSMAATAYARAGPIPCINIDAQYEGWAGATADDTMRAQHMSMVSGMCGAMHGNVTLCEFGAGQFGAAVGAAGSLSSYLNTTGAIRASHGAAFYRALNWWLMQPKTDASLVTTALGSGATRIGPARASDGSYAVIYTPAQNFTVDMTALAPSSVRARWWNPTDNSYSTDGASPLANSGTHAFTAPGTRLLLLDAAP